MCMCTYVPCRGEVTSGQGSPSLRRGGGQGGPSLLRLVALHDCVVASVVASVSEEIANSIATPVEGRVGGWGLGFRV